MSFFKSIGLDKRPSTVHPQSFDKANRFIEALNSNHEDEASRIVRSLARDRAQIQFALDMINESGNAAPHQPSKPIVKPLKYKLIIIFSEKTKTDNH